MRALTATLLLLSIALPGCGKSSRDADLVRKATPSSSTREYATEQADAGDLDREAESHTAEADKSEDPVKKIEIGQRAPDFEFTINGKTRKLSDLREDKRLTKDGVLLLTFWCSFCDSCRSVEHPLDKMAKKYLGQAGVLALDSSWGETPEAIAKVAQAQELTLPIALNPSGSAADIFGVGKTTTTVILDRDGVLRYRGQFADFKHNYAQDALQAILDGKKPPQEETRQKG